MLRFLLFADDTNTFMSGNSLSKLLASVNVELQKLNEWLCANRLSLNVSKSKYIFFGHKRKRLKNSSSAFKSMSRVKLERFESTKFLGIHIDSTLSWKIHTSHVALKVSKSISILNKLKYILPRKYLLMLYYNTLVHPHLLYCNIVWGNTTDIALHRLTILQKRIVRVISFSGFQDHSSNSFKILNILKHNDIYKLQADVLMYRAKNNLLPASCSYHVFIHDCLYNLRNKPDFVSFRYLKNIRKRFLGISGPIVWKSLPNTIRTCTSISQFVRNLTQFLMSDY